jgi:hypothetical protein
MSETIEDYLRRELAEFVEVARQAVAHFQDGPSISAGGVVVTVSPSGSGAALAEFHDRADKLAAVAKSCLRRGEPCGLTGDRRACPNFEYWDGDETFSYDCPVCGVKGGGEHPQ